MKRERQANMACRKNLINSVSVCGFQACNSLSGRESHAWTDTHTDTSTHTRGVGLFGSCPRPCYEISLGKQQGPWTGHRDRNREKKREGDCWAQIKFHCLFARPSPSLPLSIHRFLHHQPFLFYFFRNQAKPCQSLPGQGSSSVTVKSPYRSNQTLHVRSGNPAALETNWLYPTWIISAPDL